MRKVDTNDVCFCLAVIPIWLCLSGTYWHDAQVTKPREHKIGESFAFFFHFKVKLTVQTKPSLPNHLLRDPRANKLGVHVAGVRVVQVVTYALVDQIPTQWLEDCAEKHHFAPKSVKQSGVTAAVLAWKIFIRETVGDFRHRLNDEKDTCVRHQLLAFSISVCGRRRSRESE